MGRARAWRMEGQIPDTRYPVSDLPELPNGSQVTANGVPLDKRLCALYRSQISARARCGGPLCSGGGSGLWF
jgi:hypothetical protein